MRDFKEKIQYDHAALGQAITYYSKASKYFNDPQNWDEEQLFNRFEHLLSILKMLEKAYSLLNRHKEFIARKIQRTKVLTSPFARKNNTDKKDCL